MARTSGVLWYYSDLDQRMHALTGAEGVNLTPFKPSFDDSAPPPPPPPPPGSTGPVVTNMSVDPADTYIVTTFSTNVLATRQVEYSIDSGATWQFDPYTSPPLLEHNSTWPVAKDLPTSRQIYFRFHLRDQATPPNQTITPIFTATTDTLQAPPPPTSTTLVTPLDRSMYPNGQGAWSHLAPWQEWPVLYWVPPGSSFQSPNGERVHRERFLGLNPRDCFRIRFPERFTNVSRGLNINGGNYVASGCDILMNTWMGRTGLTWYDTGTDAAAKRNPLPGPRYGKSAVDSDTRVAPNDENRALMIGGNGTNPGFRTFRAWEGLKIHGQWAFEGTDYQRRSDTDTDLVMQHYHHDRVSVAYTRSSTGSYTGKSGGDALQMFDNGQPTRLWLLGFTVPKSSIQGFFSKTVSGTPSYQTFVAKDVVIRGESPTIGESAYLWWQTIAVSGTYTLQNVHIVPSSNRSRGNTITPDDSRIFTSNINDTVPADQVGLNYPFKV